MMIKLFPYSLLVATIILLFGCNNHTIKNNTLKLDNGWKFMPGNNPEYANPDFEDSRWKDISIGKRWEEQGYKDLDDFAWYRIKVKIPSAIKKSAILKDSIFFNLGHINDFDQFYLNGELIGENGSNLKEGTPVSDTFKDQNKSFHGVNRRYSLSCNSKAIRWDKKNIIAIRVFDMGNSGGMQKGMPAIEMQKISYYLKVDLSNRFKDEADEVNKKITFSNSSHVYPMKGKLKISVFNNINDSMSLSKTVSFDLAAKEKKSLSFSFPKPKESTTILYEFTFLDGSKIVFKTGFPYILTPKEKKTPQINGALIYGASPGKPFLYKIAATGERPVTFSAQNLPEGLILDEHTGKITGKAKTEGKYIVLLEAKNKFGTDTKELEIVIGDKLALTPPMGWNSWNCWGVNVSQEKIYDAAKVFIDKGLADHGWTYINIDDGWSVFGTSSDPKRDASGKILTNEKFPDIKKLGNDIHALGLKFGIYSSPGALTCGSYTASYQHELQDAKTFGEWGVDLLKYDLCSYRTLMKDVNNVEELKAPYLLMSKALKKSGRDIIYSICEYGMGNVWEWGESVGGNLWRTTRDITDTWESMHIIGFSQTENAKYAGPGYWNDPDMLVIGRVGLRGYMHRTTLTPDEQYTHVSLWALLSAPLLLGNDLTKMDDFTLNLITNDEVIAIDQDKLGNQATPAIKEDGIEVWTKKLADGNLAVGIFNTGNENKDYSLDLKQLGINTKVTLRDVWRQENLGEFSKFKTRIPWHGVILLKIILKK